MKKSVAIAVAAVLILAAAWALWQRIWVLQQLRAVLVLLADSLTVAGLLVLLPGLFLRRKRSPRREAGRKKTDLPPDLTEEDLERARGSRRRLGRAMTAAGAGALLLAAILSAVCMLLA